MASDNDQNERFTMKSFTSEELDAKMPKPKPDPLFGFPWLLIGVIFLFAVIMVRGSIDDSQSQPLSNTVASIAPVSAPMLQPDTPEQIYNRAKERRGHGDLGNSNYNSSIFELESIDKSSPMRAKANQLQYEWEQENSLKRAALTKKEQRDRKKAERETRKSDKESARTFTGNDECQIAIASVKLRRSTELHVARKGSTYVVVDVAVLNPGSRELYVNPAQFSLSDTSGDTAPAYDDTYLISNHLKSVELQPGQQCSGYLVFLMRKDSEYVLTRSGGYSGSPVMRPVIP